MQFLKEDLHVYFEISLSLFLRVLLTICHRWFMCYGTIFMMSLDHNVLRGGNKKKWFISVWILGAQRPWSLYFIDVFSCDQAALWIVQSVRPSVRLSVCHTFLTMFPSSYHHEIFRSYYHWQKWRPCKRSRSEVKGQGHRGHNPT